jgi:hypothetical protein
MRSKWDTIGSSFEIKIQVDCLLSFGMQTNVHEGKYSLWNKHIHQNSTLACMSYYNKVIAKACACTYLLLMQTVTCKLIHQEIGCV